MLPFFEEIIAQNHLEQHLEIITDFWQDILLDSTSYSNNVLKKHLDFDKKVKFESVHFDKWLAYLLEVVETQKVIFKESQPFLNLNYLSDYEEVIKSSSNI